MTHPLRAYLTKHEITEAAFSERLSRRGVSASPSYISQIIIGYRRPGGQLAISISDATAGAVTVEDMLRYAPEPKRRSRKAA